MGSCMSWFLLKDKGIHMIYTSYGGWITNSEILYYSWGMVSLEVLLELKSFDNILWQYLAIVNINALN